MVKHIMIMGGTISSTKENEGSKKGFQDLPKYIPETFKKDHKLTFSSISMKDSRDITEEDMKLLWEEMMKIPVEHIIVTHGTFTIAKTASFITKELSKLNAWRRVYFIGSESSLDSFPTDALIHLVL